jgi:hypothetical protein
MSLHLRSLSGTAGGPLGTYRGQFHIFRIVGDRTPEECVPIAIDALWRTLSREIGLDAAISIHITGVSVEPNRILIGMRTPEVHADDVARIPATFDDAEWLVALNEVSWRNENDDLRRMRGDALAAIDKQLSLARGKAVSNCGVDGRGAMEKTFEIPEGANGHVEAMKAVSETWSRLREKKGVDVAESVKLRCVRIEAGRGTICAVAPMFMASEIALCCSMQEHPGRRYVVDGQEWCAPGRELVDLRREAIRPTDVARSMMRDMMSTALRRKASMARMDPQDGPTGPIDRFTTHADGTRTVQIGGRETSTSVRRDDEDRDTVLVRLSVKKESECGRAEHDRIIAFVKSACRGHLDSDPWDIRVIGTLSQPKSESVVMQVPEGMMRVLRSTSSSVRTTDFAATDVGGLRILQVDRISIMMGCFSGLNARRLRTEPRTDESATTHPVATTAPSYDDRTRLHRIDGTEAVKESERGLIGDALFHTWRLLGAAMGFIRDPFLAMERMIDAPGTGKYATTTIAGPVTKETTWDLLRSVLHDQDGRIMDAETGCAEFERVATRWGDAQSAETSSSIGALLDRIASELQDILAFGSEAERRAAAMDTLETLERLGRRAEEERARLVRDLRTRLDTTRRFVDSKLDHRGLTSVTEVGHAA